MIAAEREHAPPAQQVEVLLAITIIEILAFASLVRPVKSDRFKHANHLFIKMAGVQRVTICLHFSEEAFNFKTHSGLRNRSQISLPNGSPSTLACHAEQETLPIPAPRTESSPSTLLILPVVWIFQHVVALTVAAAFGINASGKRGMDVGTRGRCCRYLSST